ncbi:hypothetical protein EJB05_42879, partial [Eragrostis curvula]
MILARVTNPTSIWLHLIATTPSKFVTSIASREARSAASFLDTLSVRGQLQYGLICSVKPSEEIAKSILPQKPPKTAENQPKLNRSSKAQLV